VVEVTGGTRERLVATTRAHLDRQGLEGLTLRSIAREAGVSHGAPARHFPGLGSLLAAAAAQGFRELHASVARSVADAGEGADERAQLAAAGRGYVAFARHNPGVFELMFRHERHADQDADLLEAGAAAFLQLVGYVERAQSAGWHPDRAAADLSAAIWAHVHGLVSLWIPGTLGAAVAFTGGTADLDHLLELSLELTIDPTRTRRTTNRGKQR
jgi:AcrR family transcriptional regulator